MNLPKTKANSKTSRKRDGFSTIELIITATVLTIVTGFGLLGISRARASIRLSGAAREYASYIEKARVLSIRSHADDASERSTIAINEDKTSYNITMDLDGDGDLDTRTIALPDGVAFDDVETIAFDWRGRTWNTRDGITLSNAQVSIRLKNGIDTVSVDITGSGDITINSAVFDDSVPNVTLKVGDLASNGTTSTPTTPTTPSSPTTSQEPATPVTIPDITVDPLPDVVDTPVVPDVVPDQNPASTPTSNPSPSPSASPSPSPPVEQSPTVCTLNTDIALLSLMLDGSGTIKVSHDASVSLPISASSSKPSDLQVSGGTQSVAPGGYASFTVKSKRLLGNYSVTFSTSCGQKVVPVKVVSALTLGL